VRFGYMRALIAGGLLQGLAIAAFALLAIRNPDPLFVCRGDDCGQFSISFAGVALVAYMSSLTSLGYTATQYALLSSAYTWPGKDPERLHRVRRRRLGGAWGLNAGL